MRIIQNTVHLLELRWNNKVRQTLIFGTLDLLSLAFLIWSFYQAININYIWWIRLVLLGLIIIYSLIFINASDDNVIIDKINKKVTIRQHSLRQTKETIYEFKKIFQVTVIRLPIYRLNIFSDGNLELELNQKNMGLVEGGMFTHLFQAGFWISQYMQIPFNFIDYRQNNTLQGSVKKISDKFMFDKMLKKFQHEDIMIYIICLFLVLLVISTLVVIYK